MISNDADPTAIATLPAKSLAGSQCGREVIIANVEHFRMHVVWSPGFSRRKVMNRHGLEYFELLELLGAQSAQAGTPYNEVHFKLRQAKNWSGRRSWPWYMTLRTPMSVTDSNSSTRDRGGGLGSGTFRSNSTTKIAFSPLRRV